MAKVYWITTDDEENDCPHKHPDQQSAAKCRVARQQEAVKNGHPSNFHVVKVNQS